MTPCCYPVGSCLCLWVCIKWDEMIMRHRVVGGACLACPAHASRSCGFARHNSTDVRVAPWRLAHLLCSRLAVHKMSQYLWPCCCLDCCKEDALEFTVKSTQFGRPVTTPRLFKLKGGTQVTDPQLNIVYDFKKTFRAAQNAITRTLRGAKRDFKTTFRGALRDFTWTSTGA